MGKDDLCGLYISSGESPATNTPRGTLGHRPPSLLPRDSPSASQPHATCLELTVMRTAQQEGRVESEERRAGVCVIAKGGDVHFPENMTAVTRRPPPPRRPRPPPPPLPPPYCTFMPLFFSDRATEQREPGKMQSIMLSQHLVPGAWFFTAPGRRC